MVCRELLTAKEVGSPVAANGPFLGDPIVLQAESDN